MKTAEKIIGATIVVLVLAALLFRRTTVGHKPTEVDIRSALASYRHVAARSAISNERNGPASADIVRLLTQAAMPIDTDRDNTLVRSPFVMDFANLLAKAKLNLTPSDREAAAVAYIRLREQLAVLEIGLATVNRVSSTSTILTIPPHSELSDALGTVFSNAVHDTVSAGAAQSVINAVNEAIWKDNVLAGSNYQEVVLSVQGQGIPSGDVLVRQTIKSAQDGQVILSTTSVLKLASLAQGTIAYLAPYVPGAPSQ